MTKSNFVSSPHHYINAHYHGNMQDHDDDGLSEEALNLESIEASLDRELSRI
jgi:hypothetical protein